MSFSSFRLWLPALAVLVAALGCAPEPAIRTYTITKDVPDRMLGGILLQEDRAWFFKVAGPREEIDEAADDFKTFLTSLKVAEDSQRPTWTLPEGWTVDEKPHQMRVATLLVPLKGKDDAELTVTVLPREREGDSMQYLLANINRWRDQMGQGRVSTQDLSSLEQLESEAGNVWFVSIAGRLKSGGMTPPFAGGGGGG